MDRLRISATAHGQNYLPQYYADARGALRDRGLEMSAIVRDPWSGVLDDLATGEADVVLGGLWVPAMYHGKGRELVAFGQLNARYPRVLITREAVPDFEWGWLAERTVLAPGAGGTAPYEFTAGLMREQGFDPSAVKWVRDLSGPMLRELFEEGLGDALISDHTTAYALRDLGVGQPTVDLATLAGPMPNSVYYAEAARLDELHERLVAFMAGIDEGMRELRDGADAGAVLAASFPTGPQDALLEATATYARNGIWESIRLEPASVGRWIGILRDRGLVTSDVSYDDLVDGRVAAAAEKRQTGSPN
jgi:NitT/TauT family transport system substrate-binding protein